MRYVTASTRIMRPGLYHFRALTDEEAADWLACGSWDSAIVRASLAEQIGAVLGVAVPVAREDRKLTFFPGDVALVGRVNRYEEVSLWQLAASDLRAAPDPDRLLARAREVAPTGRSLCVRRMAFLYSPGWYWYSPSDVASVEEILSFLDDSPSIHLTADATACLAEQFLLPEDLLIPEDGICRHPLIMNVGDRALICHAQSGHGFHLRFLTRLADALL